MSLDLSSNGIQSLHHLSDTKNHHLQFFSSVEKLTLTDNLITTIPDKFFEVGINGDIMFAMYEGLWLYELRIMPIVWSYLFLNPNIEKKAFEF